MSRESLFLLCPLVGLSVLAWIVTAQHMGGVGSALVMGSMTMGLPFSVTNMLLFRHYGQTKTSPTGTRVRRRVAFWPPV